VFVEISDNRSHGQDERVGVKQYFESVEFQYRLIRALSTSQAEPKP
jgi:acetylornithine deacetylase/succinyl-diaminopimelate desuccinylase-like protein